MVRLTGGLYADAGAARVGITAYAFAASLNADENTSTGSATGSDATDASGEWDITGLAEGLYDVRIDDGTTKRWRRANERVQLETIETSNLLLRNPADTFVIDIVPGAVTANRQLNVPVLTGTGTMAILEDVISGGQTFAGAITFGGAITFSAAAVAVTVTNNLRTNGMIFVGDNANANMTAGLTINQGAADNQALTLKSSDVAHGLLTAAGTQETDDFFYIQKLTAAEGGVDMFALTENPGAAGSTLRIFALGGEASTTPATNGTPLAAIWAAEHDGADALVNAPANSLIFGVSRRVAGAWAYAFFVDAEGDLHVDGGIVPTAFDAWDDWALCRAMDLVRSPAQIIRDEWDSFVHYGYADLVRAGILSDPQGGGDPMVCITQHLRLVNSAIGQLGKRLLALEQHQAEALADGK